MGFKLDDDDDDDDEDGERPQLFPGTKKAQQTKKILILFTKFKFKPRPFFKTSWVVLRKKQVRNFEFVI